MDDGLHDPVGARRRAVRVHLSGEQQGSSSHARQITSGRSRFQRCKRSHLFQTIASNSIGMLWVLCASAAFGCSTMRPPQRSSAQRVREKCPPKEDEEFFFVEGAIYP